MCLYLQAGMHYYRVCSGADSWPRDVQVCGSHQIKLCRKGMPPTSLILPEHHHVVLPQSLHSRVSVTATGFTRASVLAIAATYHPRHLRKCVRGLPHALPVASVRKLTRHPATAGLCLDPPLSHRASPRSDIMTLNVHMSLRPKLRALDVPVRECQYPLTLHVLEAGPLIVQRVHPPYHTIQAPAKVAGGCATLLYRVPDLTVTSHSAHPSGRVLITHFTMAGVAHCDANVYFPADRDLDTLQGIPDWVYPYLLLTPARVVVLTGDLNANCHWVSHLPVSPAPLCDLVLPTLARLGMRRLRPLAEAPTWVSPQGFAVALDHIFLRTPSDTAHTTEVRSDSSFPSDHLPVIATLHDLPPAPQLVCPSKKGRFPIPREPLASQLRTLNDSFRAELTPPPPGAPKHTAALYGGDLGAIHRGYGGLRAPRSQPARAVGGTRPRHQPATLHSRPPGLGVPVIAPCGDHPPQRADPGGLGCHPPGEGCSAGAPTRRARPTHQGGLPPHFGSAVCTPGGSCLRRRRSSATPSTSRRCAALAAPEAPGPP